MQNSIPKFLFCLIFFFTVTGPSGADEVDFQSWLNSFRIEALKKGISEKTLDHSLSGISPIPRVIQLDRKQPEFTLTFNQYIKRVVTATRINKARKLYDANKDLLSKVGNKYNVQPRFIVALWGIESDFGRLTGGFKIVPALATLAHDGRRSAFFRSQLFNALKIIDQGHITAQNMKGSWAGALGQVQFMPSSFLAYAVDFDGDGRKNLWGSLGDVFGSAANYLAKSGWKGDETWGRRVRLPPGFDKTLINYKKIRHPIKFWQDAGVRKLNNTDLPNINMRASLVRPSDRESDTFLIYQNYRTILKWNRSHYFALAVGGLADAIIQR